MYGFGNFQTRTAHQRQMYEVDDERCLGVITLRPLSFRIQSFLPGHFVPSYISSPVILSSVISSPGLFVPWSFCPLELNLQKFMPKDLFKM
jgi:hypothetical protein